MPIDDPDLEPIWKASSEGNFPIMYHGFHIEPPYFPGYRDIWDNPAMGRCAGQTWGGQRFLSFMLMGGMLDRYPNLRVGTMECGHGWLPQWLLRLTRQIDYVRGSVSADLKYSPMEYTEQGRVFCSVDLFEGVEMTKAVADILGDHVLMYESDYPHSRDHLPRPHRHGHRVGRRPRQEGAGQDDVGERRAVPASDHVAVVGGLAYLVVRTSGHRGVSS